MNQSLEHRTDHATAALWCSVDGVEVGAVRSRLWLEFDRVVAVVAMIGVVAAAVVLTDARRPDAVVEPEALPVVVTDDAPVGMRPVSISMSSLHLTDDGAVRYYGYERAGTEPLRRRAIVVAVGDGPITGGPELEVVQTPDGFVTIREEPVGEGFLSAQVDRGTDTVVVLSAALDVDELVAVAQSVEVEAGADVVEVGELPESFSAVGALDPARVNSGPTVTYARVGASVSEVNVDRSTLRVTTTTDDRSARFLLDVVGTEVATISIGGERLPVVEQAGGFGTRTLSVVVPFDEEALTVVSTTGLGVDDLEAAAGALRIAADEEAVQSLLEVGSSFGGFGNPDFPAAWGGVITGAEGQRFDPTVGTTARALVWLDDCTRCVPVLERIVEAAQPYLDDLEIVGVVDRDLDDLEVDGAVVVVPDGPLRTTLERGTFGAPSLTLLDEGGDLVQVVHGSWTMPVFAALLEGFVDRLR